MILPRGEAIVDCSLDSASRPSIDYMTRGGDRDAGLEIRMWTGKIVVQDLFNIYVNEGVIYEICIRKGIVVKYLD